MLGKLLVVVCYVVAWFSPRFFKLGANSIISDLNNYTMTVLIRGQVESEKCLMTLC
jgi:hypothetical protein